MLRGERERQLIKKIRSECYTSEELALAKEAFSRHEAVCFDLTDVRLMFLVSGLCDRIAEMTALPVCLHIPGKKEFFQNCLLVINTADQEDFKKAAGQTAKERSVSRFFYTLPGKDCVYSREVVADGEGFMLQCLRKAKLMIDGRDRYLVLHSTNRSL